MLMHITLTILFHKTKNGMEFSCMKILNSKILLYFIAKLHFFFQIHTVQANLCKFHQRKRSHRKTILWKETPYVMHTNLCCSWSIQMPKQITIAVHILLLFRKEERKKIHGIDFDWSFVYNNQIFLLRPKRKQFDSRRFYFQRSHFEYIKTILMHDFTLKTRHK